MGIVFQLLSLDRSLRSLPTVLAPALTAPQFTRAGPAPAPAFHRPLRYSPTPPQEFSGNLSNQWKMSGSPPPRSLPTDKLEHAALQLLLHTGFVWEISQGSWDFGIQSLAGHTAKSVAMSTAVQMTMKDDVPALHAVLDFASQTARTHDEIVGHLTSVGSVENLTHANVILDYLENDGILGPVGRRDSNGNALLKVLTPRLADAVIESLDQVPRPELRPTHDLDALPFR